jgi:hypothetical protein
MEISQQPVVKPITAPMPLPMPVQPIYKPVYHAPAMVHCAGFVDPCCKKSHFGYPMTGVILVLFILLVIISRGKC